MTSRSTLIFFLALAGLVVPASATVTYCSGSCNVTSGLNYAAFETAASSLTFPASPSSFVSGNLDGAGVYTDPSGAIFFGYANSSGSPAALTVSGTSLAEPFGSSGTSIQITLPANTYAFSMRLTATAFANPFFGTPGNVNPSAGDYDLIIANSGDTQFFGIISTTPITSLFVGSATSGGALRISDFVLGQPAAETPTPEMSSMALIGTGLLGLGFVRRRRVHKPDATLA